MKRFILGITISTAFVLAFGEAEARTKRECQILYHRDSLNQLKAGNSPEGVHFFMSTCLGEFRNLSKCEKMYIADQDRSEAKGIPWMERSKFMKLCHEKYNTKPTSRCEKLYQTHEKMSRDKGKKPLDKKLFIDVCRKD